MLPLKHESTLNSLGSRLERVCVPIPVELRAMSSETVVKGETTSTVFHNRPARRRRRREISGR